MKKITISNIINGLLFLYILSIYIFTYREGYNTLSNALAFLVVASIWIEVMLTRKKVRFNSILLFQILFIVACLITAFYAISQYTVTSKVKTLLLIFLVMLTLVNYIDTFEKLRKVIFYFVIAGFFTSIYILVTSDFSVITRYGSQLGNQNAIGMNIGISSIFCFYIILGEKKYLYSLLYILLIPCILLTGSRKALIFVILSLITMLLLYNKDSLSKIVKLLFASTCVLIGLYYFIFEIPIFYQIVVIRVENMIKLLTGESVKEASLNNRLLMTRYGVEFFKKRPVFGYGIDNYRYLYGGTYSHNNFIELLVGTGVIGFMLYYIPQVVVMRDLLMKSKNKMIALVCYSFFTIIASYFILSPTLVYYDSKHYNFLLAIASTVKLINIRNANLINGEKNV